MKNLVIVGTSETAERIYFFCKYYKLYNVKGFAVDEKYKTQDEFLNLPVWSIENLEKHIDKKHCYIFVALFWNHLNGDRKRLFERLSSDGYQFANIISPKASIRGTIGVNCWIMDYAVVQEGAKIEDNVIMADFSFVGNMTVIEKHCFLGAKSTTMGGCKIGYQTFIGTNAAIFDSTEIGNRCLIGACTIIKRNIPQFSVVKIDTSNNIVKQYPEDIIESKWVAKHNVR
jgi:sugar O-acyltransferase (sialic acid O-acetyltransferase NeuD family)